MAAITTPAGTLEGTLSKWTNVMKGWQYRFFVLDENAGLLSYYTSKEKMMKGVRRGCVRLKEAVIGIDDQEDNTFTITVDHKTFHFQAQHTEEREKWVRRLEDTIIRHANRSKLWDSQNAFYFGSYSKDPSGKRANHLEQLGRRVSEADAYLQLMIEQTNALDKRIADISDPEEQAKCKVLQDSASAMLDQIKHSIVSLQIAKNMAHPINGIYNGPTATNLSTATTASPTTPTKTGANTKAEHLFDDEDDSTTENDQLPYTEIVVPLPTNVQSAMQVQQQHTAIDPNSSHLLLMHAGSFESIADSISEGIEYGTDISSTAVMLPDATTAPLTLVVPETSYSSSEGEDDFYDAYDDPFTSLANSPVACATRGFAETSPTHDKNADVLTNAGLTTQGAVQSTNIISTNNTHIATLSANQPPTVPEVHEYDTDANVITANNTVAANITPTSAGRSLASYDNGIDYDALYEEEEDTDISMEAHGSMISHILSQVKIGMDLTKVVLPTFILERRSLLEMYADYFAHPDLFLKIAELDSPRDRIVQACRWYLSAYHAGRKSSVAKKPYNPILGEVFQCHWDIPDESMDPAEVNDGPVPWCRRDQLTFLAEQVSHHPPISAFYAEHYNKKITFTAHVWTKSKFLGLSIGVHNIGEGIVTLVDRSEEYIVTFPNGYGRSILTVPWIELGGSVEIRCPQTGYHANIEFLTKPFYGGKRNKVTAEVYSPNDKKPFVSIAGEWSGLMEAKWHDKNKTELFVDVNRIPIFKKQVRPIVEQDEYESRRVWKEVTAGLKFNDIERATNAKCDVEQAQREQAKVRKDYDLAWEHKYFKPIGDNWIYTKPLSQRIYLKEKENKR